MLYIILILLTEVRHPSARQQSACPWALLAPLFPYDFQSLPSLARHESRRLKHT